MTDELNNYRKPVFAEKVTCVGVTARIKSNKTHLVLTLEDGSEITHKLVKEQQRKEHKNNLGFEVEVTESEQVKETELSDFVPEIFKKIAEEISKNGSIELRVSYSQSALKFDDEIKVYRIMYKSHVETIYSPVLFKTKEHLETQKKKLEEYKERQKGKEVAL